MAEQKQDADEKQVDAQPINKHVSYRRVFIISRKYAYTMAIADDSTVTTTKNREMNGIEGLRFEKSAQDGVVFIASNKDPTKLLACNAEGDVVITSHRSVNGAEAWKLQPQANYVTFIVSVKFGRALSIDAEGKVQTVPVTNADADGNEALQVLLVDDPPLPIFIQSVQWDRRIAINTQKNVVSSVNRVFTGWEGLYLEKSLVDDEVYFIYKHLQPTWLLACTAEGKVYTKVSTARDPEGEEGWKVSESDAGVVNISSNYQNRKSSPLVLSMNNEDSHGIDTKPSFGVWERFRLELASLL